ncbi:MAG: Hsp20 family protein [Rhodospirillales bacterium]|nr:Hsp20 family protein [Rhodospirillales bacterium]
MRAYDFSPLFRYSIGFDRMQRLLDAASAHAETAQTYPPYNIETVGENTYRITVAVAGFREDDLDVTVKDNSLAITGKVTGANDERTYIHHGIAGRSFRLGFGLADHINVLAANLENGILHVDLERQIPEELKPRKIEIKAGPVVSFAKKARKRIGSAANKAA